MLRSCVLASVVAFGLVGCALDFDAIGFTGAGGGDGGAAATGGGPPSTSTGKTTATGTPGTCEKDDVCVPAPPFGWVGPMVEVAGDVSCGEGSSMILQAGEAVTPAPCPCEAVGATCTGGQVDYFNTDECTELSALIASNVTFSSPGGCDPVGSLPDEALGAHADVLPDVANPGMCVANNPAPEPTFLNPVRFCGLSTPVGCADDGACVPPGGSPCIAAMNAQACPAEYPGLHGIYQSAAQTCACTTAPNLLCSGELGFFADSACSGSPVANLDLFAATICASTKVPSGGIWARYFLASEPTCSDGTPAFQQQTWTVCCL